MGLSLAQVDTPSKFFYAENRIFFDKMAVVMRAWKFWIFITLRLTPTYLHFSNCFRVNDYGLKYGAVHSPLDRMCHSTHTIG